MPARKLTEAARNNAGTLAREEKKQPTRRKDIIHEQALAILRECSMSKGVEEALRTITTKACGLVGGKGGSVWLRSSEDPNRIILRWTYRPEGPNKVGEAYYSGIPDENGYYEGLTAWVFAMG